MEDEILDFFLLKTIYQKLKRRKMMKMFVETRAQQIKQIHEELELIFICE